MPKRVHVRHPEELVLHLARLSREDLEGFARKVFDALYLMPDYKHPPLAYNSDKECDHYVCEIIYGAVSDCLHAYPAEPLPER